MKLDPEDLKSLFAPNDKIIEKSVLINVPVSRVWEILTDPAWMKQWVAESTVDVIYDQKVGSTMLFEGKWHGLKLNDKGIVLQFEKDKIFEYSYWSSFTKLSFIPENSTVNQFTLVEHDGQTLLSLKITNMTTVTSYGHSNFYWGITLPIIKSLCETGSVEIQY